MAWEPLSKDLRSSRIYQIEIHYGMGGQISQIIASEASRLNLKPIWLWAMFEVESGWNPWRPRFEPEFNNQLRLNIKGLTETDYILRSTSWGLGQILGQTSLEKSRITKKPRFIGDFPRLMHPIEGIPIFANYLREQLDVYGGDTKIEHTYIENGIAAYNAGSFVLDKSTGKYINEWHVAKFRIALDILKKQNIEKDYCK